MRVSFIFLFYSLLYISVSNVPNDDIFFNLNVPPAPIPPCPSLTRSEGQLNEKKPNIDLFPSIETMFLILFSALLMLLWLDLPTYLPQRPRTNTIDHLSPYISFFHHFRQFIFSYPSVFCNLINKCLGWATL
jgi:hypothetical protein